MAHSAGDPRPQQNARRRTTANLLPSVASALAAASRHGDATALSLIDPLTGLDSRRALDADLMTLGSTQSSGQETAIVRVDVDHFEYFNPRCSSPTAPSTTRRRPAATV